MSAPDPAPSVDPAEPARVPLRPSKWAMTAVALAAVALALIVVAAQLHSGAVHRLDVRIDDQVNRYVHRHPAQVRTWKVFSAVGGPLTWRILAGIGAIALWLKHQRRQAVLVVVVMAGAAALSGLVKVWAGRVRPTVPFPIERVGGGSFPSGHALTSFTALALLIVLAWSRVHGWWRAVLVILAAVVVLAIGASRLMLGVHYLSDILGGWLIGGLWLTAVLAAARSRWADRIRLDDGER